MSGNGSTVVVIVVAANAVININDTSVIGIGVVCSHYYFLMDLIAIVIANFLQWLYLLMLF